MTQKDQARRSPLAIDLFCGAGGMSLGFEDAGWDVVGAFDIDATSVRTYQQNFPNALAFEEDLGRITGSEIRRLLGVDEMTIDLVFGGPPCQGFSIGGKRRLNDPRNRGVREFARLVCELRPRYFVLENVQGLTFETGAQVLQGFLRKMKSAGYTVASPLSVLDAASFGIPQRRRRLFILGSQEGEPVPAYPLPLETRVDVWSAIADLACIEGARSDVQGGRYRGTLGWPSEYARNLRKSRDVSVAPGTDEVVNLSGCEVALHSPQVVERFANTVAGKVEPISRFMRLHRTGLAPTLRAGTGPSHGSFTAPRPIHPEFARCITVREAARLHSFPDWFEFDKTSWHAFMQIGNSVPPRLAEAVAQGVLAAACTNESAAGLVDRVSKVA